MDYYHGGALICNPPLLQASMDHLAYLCATPGGASDPAPTPVVTPAATLSPLNEDWAADDSCDDDAAFFDPERISQVINHLLSNAIKYSDQDKTIDIDISMY